MDTFTERNTTAPNARSGRGARHAATDRARPRSAHRPEAEEWKRAERSELTVRMSSSAGSQATPSTKCPWSRMLVATCPPAALLSARPATAPFADASAVESRRRAHNLGDSTRRAVAPELHSILSGCRLGLVVSVCVQRALCTANGGPTAIFCARCEQFLACVRACVRACVMSAPRAREEDAPCPLRIC